VEPLLAILLVFALLALCLWWLRQRGAVQILASRSFRFFPERKSKGNKILQKVDALALSPTHSLNLVRMADRAILVGISPSGFYLVESSPWKSLEPHTVPVTTEGGQS
jgi:flagellar biogenesis protein FliO